MSKQHFSAGPVQIPTGPAIVEVGLPLVHCNGYEFVEHINAPYSSATSRKNRFRRLFQSSLSFVGECLALLHKITVRNAG